MIQTRDGIRFIGIIASAVILCGCSQTRSTATAPKAIADVPGTNMQEVVITASRQSTPPKG